MPNTPNWKKNLRRIPDKIAVKLKTIKERELIVSCSKTIPSADIANGLYEHLGLNIINGKLDIPDEFVPDSTNGRYSSMNADGYEIIHDDLPKITKSYTWEVPNWGDSYNGTHDVTRYRDVYPRTLMPPKALSMKIELLNHDKANNRYSLIFTINEVLDRKGAEFEDTLLENLNILQENIGVVDVYHSTVTLADYLSTLTVNWEILPPGERDDIINKILKRFRTTSPEVRAAVQERYDILAGLGPISWINGTSGFRRYFGAQFRDNLVVFENLEYGNAIYIMYDDWKNLSQLSRYDLLKDNRQGFTRIVHSKGWQKQLKSYVKGLLNPSNN